MTPCGQLHPPIASADVSAASPHQGAAVAGDSTRAAGRLPEMRKGRGAKRQKVEEAEEEEEGEEGEEGEAQT